MSHQTDIFTDYPADVEEAVTRPRIPSLLEMARSLKNDSASEQVLVAIIAASSVIILFAAISLLILEIFL